MNTCATCLHWIPANRYVEGREKPAIDMICSHNAFEFGGNSSTVRSNGLTTDAYHVSAGNCNIITGPKFGCIHHTQK